MTRTPSPLLFVLAFAPLLLVTLVSGACKALTAAEDATITKDTADVCAVAEAVDPTGATVVCAFVDAAENLILPRLIVCPTPAAAASVVAALPASTTVTAKLRAAVAAGLAHDGGAYSVHR